MYYIITFRALRLLHLGIQERDSFMLTVNKLTVLQTTLFRDQGVLYVSVRRQTKRQVSTRITC